MISLQSFVERRAELKSRIGSGLILIPGNTLVPNCYPNNAYYFRQDSTFRYLFGLDIPSLFAVIDVESGEEMLFGDDYTVDDIIWMGPQPTLRELGAEVGVSQTHPLKELERVVHKAMRAGRRVHYLPPYRSETKLHLSELLGIAPSMLHTYKSADLIFAVAEMREVKSAEEIASMQDAFQIGYTMHTTAMKMCRQGIVEREIAGALEGVARSIGQGVSFQSICSQHGETLHNINQDGILSDGRLFLCDAGGENLDGYCSDHTRTYPVSGKFSPLQRDIYNIVLAAHDHVIEVARPMKYMDLQRASFKVLAEGLKGIGLLSGSIDQIIESGAVSLFMPHGLGHGLGLDVHDCEGFGERSFDFSEFAERAAASATCIYRKEWMLRPGTVLTDEPGLYFIPALIDQSRSQGLYTGIVNYDKLDSLRDFGGIRIEDDLIITESGNCVMGDKHIPTSIEEIENFMAQS
ncbi:MAG: aminopeptidase P family protein [Rikenellaceae bacterium]